MRNPNMKKTLYLLLLCIGAFFLHNTATNVDIMEARNYVTAYEMAHDGHWLVPTMNGELRLEKPPLPTWVAGAIECVAPDNLAAQRCAAGVMGCLWVLFFYLLARRLVDDDNYAFLSTIVFLTCYQIVLMGRTATWDVYCHAFMTGAIYFLTRAFYPSAGEGRRRVFLWYVLAGLCLGLSFMSKGPVSFYALLLPWLVATICCYRRPQLRGRRGALSLMLVVMLVVGAAWYVWVFTFHPEVSQAVVQKESGSWLNRHVRPWHYYWRYFSETGVWAILTLAALVAPYWRRHLRRRREYMLTLVWTLAALVLLSLMPEKKLRYVLPMMVPCALAVGLLLDHFRLGLRQDVWARRLFVTNGAVVSALTLVGAVGVPLYAWHTGLLSPFTAVVAGLLLLGVGVWMILATRQRRPVAFTMAVGALFLIAEALLMRPIAECFGNRARHSIAETRQVAALDGLPFYNSTREELRIELVYAAHRKIRPLDLHDAAAVRRALPCAIVTRRYAAEELPADVLQSVDTLHVGTYDDNKHPPGTKHYNELFHNHVTLLRPKAESADAPH